MSAFGLYRMIMNVANVAKELETAGMRIEIGDDFAAYRLLRNAQKDRAPMYPMLMSGRRMSISRMHSGFAALMSRTNWSTRRPCGCLI